MNMIITIGSDMSPEKETMIELSSMIELSYPK